MNSKGHLYISLAKSLIRIGSAIAAIWMREFEILALGIMIAEICGILEEVYDKR